MVSREALQGLSLYCLRNWEEKVVSKLTKQIWGDIFPHIMILANHSILMLYKWENWVSARSRDLPEVSKCYNSGYLTRLVFLLLHHSYSLTIYNFSFIFFSCSQGDFVTIMYEISLVQVRRIKSWEHFSIEKEEKERKKV